MGLRLLLDEHVEHEVMHRLENRRHDVEHIDLHETLNKGDTDQDLVQYSRSDSRLIVTYDDDFLGFPEQEYHCVLFFGDESMSAKNVADVVHTVSEQIPEDELRGLQRSAETGCSSANRSIGRDPVEPPRTGQ